MPSTQHATRPPRYPASEQHALQVCLEAAEPGKDLTIGGKLLDLSPGGAKVLLDGTFRFQQAVRLRLDSVDIGLHLCVSARVCWIRPHEELWQLGCSFHPPLPQEDVERLLSAGVLDRRRAVRETVEKLATALWELNPQPTPVTVADLSRGGFCLRSALPAEPGSRLRLQVPTGDESIEATATVQWRMQAPEGYLLGCSLTSLESYVLLRSALLPLEEQCSNRLVRWLSSWLPKRWICQ